MLNANSYLDRVDLLYYHQHIAGFLPDEVLDCHTHVYRADHAARPWPKPATWAEYFSPRTWPLSTLRRYYEILLPGKRVTPVIFGMPAGEVDVDAANDCVLASAAGGNAYPFMLTRPEWSAAELDERVRRGSFKGIKPYPTFAPGHSPHKDASFLREEGGGQEHPSLRRRGSDTRGLASCIMGEVEEPNPYPFPAKEGGTGSPLFVGEGPGVRSDLPSLRRRGAGGEVCSPLFAGEGLINGRMRHLSWEGPAPPSGEVSIFDFLPREHLRVAEALGLVVMLHIPRAKRLADPDNVAELHRIVTEFPALKLVVAHIGRAYCLPTATKGLAAMRDCPGIVYDFSASANADVFELALREVGPERLIFGSDLPAVAFRARRLCEGDNYVNVVRRANFADPHLRVAAPEERDGITFYLYEQITAFRIAAERVGLSRSQVEDVFRNNALRLLDG